MTEHIARSSATRTLYAALLAALVFVSPNAYADTALNYGININTASLPFDSNGLFFAGVDLQFDPGIAADTQDAEAYNTPFSFCCSFLSFTTTGDVSAAPPPANGAGIFENNTPYNDLFSQLEVSKSGISFNLTFSGPAIDTPDPALFPSGSSFGISLYNGEGTTPYLTSDPNGFLGILTLNPNGTVTTRTFSNANGGPSAITITDLNQPPPPPPVPEPGTLILLGTGLTGILGLIRRRVRT